jgi:hypothetical protein
MRLRDRASLMNIAISRRRPKRPQHADPRVHGKVAAVGCIGQYGGSYHDFADGYGRA